MAYEKLNLTDGMVLTAEHMSHIEDGISEMGGADGVGISSVKQTTTSADDGGTNVVTVTLTNGAKSTFQVKNGGKGSQGDKGETGAPGKDGGNGVDGEDGFSPTVVVNPYMDFNPDGSTESGNRITITDKDGEHTVKIPDGATGPQGETGDHGESAHEIALRNGFVGDEKAWLASLHAANPIVLNKGQYPTETEAIAYMDAQGDNAAVYVWNNKLFAYASMEVQSKGGGACLYGYRNSASSGLKVAEYGMLAIVPVSDITAPVEISITGYTLSQSPYIYGGTNTTAFPTTLIANDTWGNQDPSPITITDLKGCGYVAFCLNITSSPVDITITVNGESMVLKSITAISEIEGALSSGGSTVVNGFADSGVEYTAIVGQDNSNAYLDSRNTYVMPVPGGYCETHIPGKTITANWLSLYDFATMTAMFSALATEYPDYVTETVLGKDASGTYDIKQYILDAPSSLSSGYTSAIKREKPVFILTSGLHGDEQDAVHTVYHFMKDLCENYMESDELEYLRRNVKFVVVPLCNPWGYVNKAHYNSNSVDLNKNFECGYQNNGTANTGTAANSEAETVLLKGVFDTYSNAVFHLECHGKMQEANPFNTTIWFSLMQSLSSELIELCADTITNQIGRRLYKMGYETNKSVGGYITYYGLNGRPKDYTGTKYGILSATMEGCGRLYGETGYSANTQKINCEALENFVLRVMDALSVRV